ncbi:MAG: DUF2384 domain-containing protein [bacterium]|nr:DUF2384 domain-containing protein [bacterium]
MIAIHEAITAVFGYSDLSHPWIRRHSMDFSGNTPMERMLHGNVADLVAVRRYLESLIV